MSRTTAFALIAIGVILNNLAYLKDPIVGDDMYVGWKGWLGIAVGIAVTIVGVAALAKGPQRPT